MFIKLHAHDPLLHLEHRRLPIDVVENLAPQDQHLQLRTTCNQNRQVKNLIILKKSMLISLADHPEVNYQAVTNAEQIGQTGMCFSDDRNDRWLFHHVPMLRFGNNALRQGSRTGYRAGY